MLETLTVLVHDILFCYDVDFKKLMDDFRTFRTSPSSEVIFVHKINQMLSPQTPGMSHLDWSYGNSAEHQWKIYHSCVCTVSHWMSSTTVYIVVVCCPSVLKAPTDNRLLAGWWLRKATRGGVVMATEACQTDCWNWTSVNTQSIPPSLHSHMTF